MITTVERIIDDIRDYPRIDLCQYWVWFIQMGLIWLLIIMVYGVVKIYLKHREG